MPASATRANAGAAETPAERGRSPKWALALSGLSSAERRDIHACMRTETLRPRSIMFRQGSPSSHLVVLQSGRARLLQTHANGQEFTFGVFVSGTILGLAAVVLERPHVLTAEAIDTIAVSTLSRTDFARLTHDIPKFLVNVTRLLALLSVEGIERSGPMVLDDARVRLATILLSLARQSASAPSISGLTQEDLAKMVGVTRTWIGSTLNEFEQLGLLTKCRAALTIADPARLERFVAMERKRRS
jgi:CRP-like cAMP-binding protein